MPNRHFFVKYWKWQKAVPILPHEGKALLELFCLQPIVFVWRQNSSSRYFASRSKIKIHDFTLADQDWIGLMIFKNFVDMDWIGFCFIRSGLKNFTVRSSLGSGSCLTLLGMAIIRPLFEVHVHFFHEKW